MASLAELYKIAILLCPVISSLFAILILFFDIRSSLKKPQKLNYYLLVYFITVFISWSSAIVYFYIPVVYVYINWISMLVFILMQVVYYGFIFEVTRTSEKEKFSILNYLFPFLASISLLVVSLIIPFQDQLKTIISKGVYVGGSKLFFYFSYSKMVLKLIISLIYTILGFKRLLEYRRVIKDFSSNEEKVSLRWVTTLLLFSVLLLPAVPLVVRAPSREAIIYSPEALFLVLSLLGQYAYICLHVIKKNLFIIDFSGETTVSQGSSFTEKQRFLTHQHVNYGNFENSKIDKNEKVLPDEDNRPGHNAITIADKGEEETKVLLQKKNVLNRAAFDAFIEDEKPYLNPELRITDMVDILHVNRTYISSFINREYGVNFSVFINQHRLLEYNALKEMPEYCKMSKPDLAAMAGFNSYRSFQRTLKEFSKGNKKLP